MHHRKVLLLILDGWGLTDQTQYSAIAHAKTPFIDSLYQKYPHTSLEASGKSVGLPPGQMGNSEVGHIHIGAGRVIPQSLVRINQAIESGELAHNQALLAAFDYAKKQQKAVHFIGLVSDGGVHSHIDHLKALCSIAKENGIEQLFIHAFTDGRDTDPHSGLGFLNDLVAHTKQTTGQLASIMGRYYAMDRDQRWERTKIAYDALVHGKGLLTSDWQEVIKQTYSQGITDEFIKPILVTHQDGRPLACIRPGDVVLCFNFRTDRSRQLTQVLTQVLPPILGIEPMSLYYLTLTVYDETFQGVSSIFDKAQLVNTLGEVLSKYEKTQLRIAETEKYPHVTYFFSGGREEPFVGEQRILCPSPKVSTYDQQPEMAAWDITAQAISILESQTYDFIGINFANPDMVGHTGNWQATIKACEVVDTCVEKLINMALKRDYLTLIVADHGNAEQMLTQTGSPYTAHTTNLVPCILVDKHFNKPLQPGTLADLAPTILQCIGIPIPAEMDGTPLFSLQ
jgi:2,3-bisphosphoglycerate-independent phosphoglycerate mutase